MEHTYYHVGITVYQTVYFMVGLALGYVIGYAHRDIDHDN